MEINVTHVSAVSAAETCAIDLENSSKESDVERLHQKVSTFLIET